MRTLSFAVVIATVTVAHADPLEDHLQALRGYGVPGLHDATALIARNGLAGWNRSGRHSKSDEDPIGYFEHELAKHDAVIFGMGHHYTGPSSFAPKYDPADWGTDPTSPVLYNGGVPDGHARRVRKVVMHEGQLSGDEVILLWMSMGAGGFGAFRWYWRLSKTGAVVHPGHLFVWLGVVPPLALAGIFIVLKVASSFDVRNSFSYLLLYTTLGASWIFLSAYLMEKAGVSFRDDAVERRNPAAAILVGSAVVAHATIYAGANIGDGPGWWAVVAAGLIGTGVWFLSWSVVELCRSVSEETTVERDVPIAIRLAGFALATGLVCARGSAGDWTSLAQTFIEFRSAWPILPFTAAAIVLESLLKTKPRSTRPGINGSVIIAICYLALAFAAVHTSGPLPNNSIYDHAAVP